MLALIAQRQAKLALAEEEFDRAAELADRGVNARSVAEGQGTGRTFTGAALNAAEAQLHPAERGAEAGRALVAQYEIQVADATLTAPPLGRVLCRPAQPGEVPGGGGKLETLLDLS